MEQCPYVVPNVPMHLPNVFLNFIQCPYVVPRVPMHLPNVFLNLVKISLPRCKLSHNFKSNLATFATNSWHHMNLSITIMDPSSHASIFNRGKRGKKNEQSEWKCHAGLSAHDPKHGCHNIKNVPILGQCKHHHGLVYATKWIICFTSNKIIFSVASYNKVCYAQWPCHQFDINNWYLWWIAHS